MAISNIRGVGSFATNTTTPTPLVISPNTTVPAGDLVIIHFTTDGTVDSIDEVSDTEGNLWIDAVSFTGNTFGADTNGIRGSVWYSILEFPITTSTVISGLLQYFDLVNGFTPGSSPDHTITLLAATITTPNVGFLSFNQILGSATSGSATVTNSVSRQYLQVGFYSGEGEDTAKTPDANFTEVYDLVSTTAGAAAANNMSHVQYRLQTTGANMTCSISGLAAVDGGFSLICFYEIDNPTITLNSPSNGATSQATTPVLQSTPSSSFSNALQVEVQLFSQSMTDYVTSSGIGDITVNSGFPTMCALSDTRIVYINHVTEQLLVFDFNGSSWSQVGTAFTVVGLGSPDICKLDTNRIALVDASLAQLRCYEFDGSTWSQIGSSLSLPATSGFYAIDYIATNQVLVVFPVSSGGLVGYRYHFGGSSFTQFLSNYNFLINVPTSLTPDIVRLSDYLVAIVYAGSFYTVLLNSSDLSILSDSSSSTDMDYSNVHRLEAISNDMVLMVSESVKKYSIIKIKTTSPVKSYIKEKKLISSLGIGIPNDPAMAYIPGKLLYTHNVSGEYVIKTFNAVAPILWGDSDLFNTTLFEAGAPFPSGTLVDFTVSPALSTSTTYYWRARAYFLREITIGYYGSIFSTWTTAWSFTTGAAGPTTYDESITLSNIGQLTVIGFRIMDFNSSLSSVVQFVSIAQSVYETTVSIASDSSLSIVSDNIINLLSSISSVSQINSAAVMVAEVASSLSINSSISTTISLLIELFSSIQTESQLQTVAGLVYETNAAISSNSDLNTSIDLILDGLISLVSNGDVSLSEEMIMSFIASISSNHEASSTANIEMSESSDISANSSISVIGGLINDLSISISSDSSVDSSVVAVISLSSTISSDNQLSSSGSFEFDAAATLNLDGQVSSSGNLEIYQDSSIESDSSIDSSLNLEMNESSSIDSNAQSDVSGNVIITESVSVDADSQTTDQGNAVLLNVANIVSQHLLSVIAEAGEDSFAELLSSTSLSVDPSVVALNIVSILSDAELSSSGNITLNEQSSLSSGSEIAINAIVEYLNSVGLSASTSLASTIVSEVTGLISLIADVSLSVFDELIPGGPSIYEEFVTISSIAGLISNAGVPNVLKLIGVLIIKGITKIK